MHSQEKIMNFQCAREDSIYGNSFSFTRRKNIFFRSLKRNKSKQPFNRRGATRIFQIGKLSETVRSKVRSSNIRCSTSERTSMSSALVFVLIKVKNFNLKQMFTKLINFLLILVEFQSEIKLLITKENSSHLRTS